MTRIAPRLAVLLLAGMLAGVLSPGVGAGPAADGPARLTDVSVESSQDGATVRIKTSGSVKYEASLIDTPTRLLIDFSGTVYAWSKTSMPTDAAPIREVRGSQFRPGVARVVVEMTRPMGYRIEQGPEGLVVSLEPTAAVKAPARAAAPSPRRQEPPLVVSDSKPAAPKPAGEATAEATKPAPVVAAAPPAPVEPKRPAKAEGPIVPAAPVEAKRPVKAEAAPAGVAQAPVAAPAPVEAKRPAKADAAPAVVAHAPVTSSAAPVEAKRPVKAEAAPTVVAQAPVAAPVEAKRPAKPEAVPAVLQVAAAPGTTAETKRPAKAEPLVVAQASAAREAPLSSPFVGQARPGAPTAPPPPPPPPAAAADGGKLITLDFKDADVLNLLRILAAEGGRNIVAGEDVRGKVSVSLRNVTWEQALDTILEVRGLAKVERGNVIRIVSLDQLTKEREAQARLEDARRRAEVETRTKVAEAQLKEAELAAKRFAARLAEEETIARGPLREETIRLSYADPNEVAGTLQGIMGIPPEGTAAVPIGAVPAQSIPAEPTVVPSSGTINPGLGRLPQPNSPVLSPPGTGQAMVSVSQDVLAKGITIRAHKPTNSVFIRHYDKDLERIKKLVREQLDVPLPQVKIESRMEILDRNALEAIGIQWGGAIAKQSGSTTVVGQGFQSAPGVVPGQTLPVVGGVLAPDGSTVLVNPTGPSRGGFNIPLGSLFGVDQGTGLPTGGNLVNLPFQLLPNAASQIPAAGIAFGIIGTDFNINLALQALANQGKTRTLARPEIVTVENSKATMSLGEEIPYATVSSAGTQIQFKEALLKLDVTPTVIRERIGAEDIRRIKLIVVIENNSRGDLVNLGSGGTPPAINRRKAETQVLIREGERLVIGGVTQSTISNNVRKVPLLGDIPILGWLFKQRENFESGRELVIFVTPSLLRNDGVAVR